MVSAHAGPDGFGALSRLDQGGAAGLERPAARRHPVSGREPDRCPPGDRFRPGGGAVCTVQGGHLRQYRRVHIAHDRPSSVFASPGLAGTDAIAAGFNDTVAALVQDVCDGE
jgi:hypothetical protein